MLQHCIVKFLLFHREFCCKKIVLAAVRLRVRLQGVNELQLDGDTREEVSIVLQVSNNNAIVGQ